MIRRICLYAGPGAGKSAAAAGLYHQLKKRKFEVEQVREFIKDWAYEGRVPRSFQQFLIFAQQMNLEDSPLLHVNHVVTDSPLLLTACYCEHHGFIASEMVYSMVDLYEKSFPGLHIFLDREGIEYSQSGRYETLDQAKELDHLIESRLRERHTYAKFKTVDMDGIVDFVVEQLRNE